MSENFEQKKIPEELLAVMANIKKLYSIEEIYERLVPVHKQLVSQKIEPSNYRVWHEIVESTPMSSTTDIDTPDGKIMEIIKATFPVKDNIQ